MTRRIRGWVVRSPLNRIAHVQRHVRRAGANWVGGVSISHVISVAGGGSGGTGTARGGRED